MIGNFKYVIFKQLSFGNLWKNGNFLAIFWHFICNLPEGQVCNDLDLDTLIQLIMFWDCFMIIQKNKTNSIYCNITIHSTYHIAISPACAGSKWFSFRYLMYIPWLCLSGMRDVTSFMWCIVWRIFQKSWASDNSGLVQVPWCLWYK